jgi:histidine phosphotransferase ChpT
MSHPNEIELAALLCSRLCHDLISPVGAISNGIEILGDEEDESMRTEVIKLLDKSAMQTSNSLKFFRLAFGAAGGFGMVVPLDDAKMAISGLFSGSKVDLIWNSNIGVMDKNAIKTMLNMALIVGESIIRGGELKINIDHCGEEISINVTAVGPKIIFQDKVKDTLLQQTLSSDLDTKTVPAYLAIEAAKKLKSKINYLGLEDDRFTLSFSYVNS